MYIFVAFVYVIYISDIFVFTTNFLVFQNLVLAGSIRVRCTLLRQFSSFDGNSCNTLLGSSFDGNPCNTLIYPTGHWTCIT